MQRLFSSDASDGGLNATFKEFVPGQKVGAGRYTLIGQVGRGGMGVVWLATDDRLNSQVALKFLPAEVGSDAMALDDLRRETLKSRQLTHANIIRIHDFYEAEGESPFISMEYVDGPNLVSLRMEQSPPVLPWSFVAPLMKQLCEALEYAHGEKVIHRDLKPGNLMLDSRGRLKLADFGIAATLDDSMTRVSLKHSTSGTLPYMSPQQMDGRMPRPTDDIYSLGATLYELLTSRPPFHTGDVAHQVRNLAPEPLDQRLAALGLANDIPLEVSALTLACLAKDPDARPQSARAVAEWIGLEVSPADTEGSLSPETTDAVATNASRRWVWMALSLVLIALIGVGGWFATNGLKNQSARQNLPRVAKAFNVESNRSDPPTLAFTLTNMIWIPRGTFRMGSADTDPDKALNETPQTEVTITRGIWLSKFEVTQADYLSVMSANPSKFTGDPNRPVERVGWQDAMTYCEKLNARERQAGHTFPGYVYRLPTEAEWEYAARAGTTNQFSFGDNASLLEEYAWFSQNSGKTTHPVGEKRPNPWGLYDMYGNVWEWCMDWKGTYAGSKVSDPTGALTGSFRVNRGGCWFDLPVACRSANRFNLVGTKGFEFVGFRVAFAPALSR